MRTRMDRFLVGYLSLVFGLLGVAFAHLFSLSLMEGILAFVLGAASGYAVARGSIALADLLLGCGDGRIPSDSGPMTANIPAEAAMALGLTAPGDEAYIEVTEVNSDGSVVVMAEMEEAEDSAAPAPPMQGPAIPPELGKMLGT